MVNIHIIIGHKKGNKEFEYNIVTANSMYQYLKSKGCNVTLDSYNTEVYEEIAYINSKGFKASDIIISVHYNAGGGDGFECYYYANDDEMMKMCKNIESEVISYAGQNSRGCKGDTGYLIIKEVQPHSVILEGGFMDNATDWNGIKLDFMGVAYARGVCKYLGINTNDTDNLNFNYLMFNGKKYKVVEV